MKATAEPTATTARATAVAGTARPTPSGSASGPTAESNWNKPIESPAETREAVVNVSDEGPGAATFGLFAIMGGVLLVGLAGLAFALWSRNRLASHW
jgi:hypothetical protein